jgi:hypothetical protein
MRIEVSKLSENALELLVRESLPGYLYAPRPPPSSRCTLSHHTTMSTGASKSVGQRLWQALGIEGTRGTGGYSHSLRCFSQNAMASAACTFAMPMRAPSSCAGAMSMSSSPSPSDTGSTYVASSESTGSGVGAPELRRSGVRWECGRATDRKPVSGLVMSTSTGGKVSSASRAL